MGSLPFEEAIRLIQEDGFEAGAIGHILTFGETNPEEQRTYPIIGLSSVAGVGLNRHVPALWDDGGERGLYLFWFSHDWDDYYRFLGARRCSDLS